MNREVPSLTPVLVTESKCVKVILVIRMPAMIVADTHNQLGIHMLGMRVTWLPFTGLGPLHARWLRD